MLNKSNGKIVATNNVIVANIIEGVSRSERCGCDGKNCYSFI